MPERSLEIIGKEMWYECNGCTIYEEYNTYGEKNPFDGITYTLPNGNYYKIGNTEFPLNSEFIPCGKHALELERRYNARIK